MHLCEGLCGHVASIVIGAVTVGSGDLRNTVAASVLDKKLRERIVAIATGKAPGLPAADAE